MVKQVPSKILYTEILKKLIDMGDIRCVIICRLAAEGSMCRVEIANAHIDQIDSTHKRGLELSIAKRVRGRYGKQSRMRLRCIPLNTSLYEFLQDNLDFEQAYVIPRKQGDFDKAFSTRQFNNIFYKHNLPFTVHQLRHYFKTQVWQWMIKNGRPDIGVIKEIMGHRKTVHESYGRYPWEYKLEIVDKVFADAGTNQNKNFDMSHLEKAIANGIVKGLSQIELEKSNYLFIKDWIDKVTGQFTPSDMYSIIHNGDSLWINLSFELRMQIRQHKDFFMRLDADTILQLLKQQNLGLYSTIINTPKGMVWFNKQINDIKKEIWKE